ncbi:MAG: histidine kinase [Acidobacteria bacterium]|nr:MAG: histidine kinase [Acidobacteriota bacterium]
MTTKGDENELLRSVALQNATSILTARRRAERRSEVYLAEAQRLSHTGSFGWKPSTGEIIWSEETFRIFQYDRSTKPTVELVLQRVHPEDVALNKQIIERASQEGKDFDFEHRLLMPDASVKHIHVVARAERDDSGELEFVGAVMDVSDRKRAEEELRRSEALAEQRLRLVVDTTPAMINSCRPDGHLDYVNKGWLDYFGFSLETALDRADVMKMSVPSKTDRYGGDWQPIIHPEDLQGFRDQWKATLASSKPGEHEARVRRFDGEYRWHLFRAVPLYDETGKPVKWYTSAFDIEDRKRVEVLLAGEKRLLEMIARGDSRELILEGACLLVEELASGCLSSILLLDPNANCLRHGAAPSLPKPYTEAIDGAVVGPSAGSCGTAAYRTEPVIVSDIATDPLWANYRDLALAHGLRACWSTPILSSEGKVLGTFAIYYREPRSPAAQDHSVIRQITHLASIAIERKQAEEALRRSEGYLAEAQRLTRTGSWAWNVASRRSIYWSQENYRLFGFDPEEGIPSDEVFYQRVHPEDRDRVRREVFLERPDEGSHFDVEFRIVLPDGAIEYVRSTGHPVRNISGDLLEYVGTSIDVTERKRADEERERLRQAQADLAHVNRVTTMGELTASLAHEVNQPIAAAITNANTCMRWLAADTPNLEEARAAAMRIVKDGTRAAEIIKRVRLLFKKGTPERELVDLNEVVRDMIVLLRSEATRYSISVRTKLAADLPEVVGDRVQLQQVLMNLMINGIDAMRDVDGTRELVVKSERGEYEQALVSVSDTGVGLPQQQADQIFNAFFTTKSHGTGMGLRISRSIVESYGGRLWAAENSPRGASFYVTLPTKAEALE